MSEQTPESGPGSPRRELKPDNLSGCSSARKCCRETGRKGPARSRGFFRMSTCRATPGAHCYRYRSRRTLAW